MLLEAMTEVADYISTLALEAEVTTNALNAGNALNNGRAVIVVTPPAITGLTASTNDFHFETAVISPWRELQKDFETLEPLISELMSSLLMPTEAKPSVFQAFDGQSYACYQLTHTTYSD